MITKAVLIFFLLFFSGINDITFARDSNSILPIIKGHNGNSDFRDYYLQNKDLILKNYSILSKMIQNNLENISAYLHVDDIEDIYKASVLYTTDINIAKSIIYVIKTRNLNINTNDIVKKIIMNNDISKDLIDFVGENYNSDIDTCIYLKSNVSIINGNAKFVPAFMAIIKNTNMVDETIRNIKYFKSINSIDDLYKTQPENDMQKLILMKKISQYNVIPSDSIVDSITNLEIYDHTELWLLKKSIAMYLINKSEYNKAYKIISSHELKYLNNANKVDKDWLSGWIALEFLNKPSDAIDHFKKHEDLWSYAITKSRMYYWIGMAYKAQYEISKKDGYEKSYKLWMFRASRFPMNYYGQYAIKELGLSFYDEMRLKLDECKNIAQYDDDSIRISSLLYKEKLLDQAKDVLLYNLGDKHLERMCNIMKFADQNLDSSIAYQIHKSISRYNVYMGTGLYKVKDLSHSPIISSVIRQESGFSHAAISNKGAMGFMQLMPDTAKEVARKIGIRYSQHDLLHNPDYNIKLGTYYIDMLNTAYNGNKILLLAAYNAGSSPVKRWLQNNGDVSKMNNCDVINWVEKITYSQTRDYVMRTMENYNVYLNIKP
jgi:hypothetical protein